ncbi:unknown [Fusobacterium sp. CAG:439]|nr:unknown [Fusobacterium sp. CAG:439]
MKKILIIFLLLFSTCLSAYSFDYIKEKQYVFYNPQTEKWSLEQTSPKDIRLMYKMFVGSGGFSEYYNNKGKLAIGPFTNMEFINNGDFIGVDNANLKFVKYVYNDGYFNIVPLNEKYIQTLFPDAQIIKISQFKNNEITIYKKPFEKKKYLILNDTKKGFYKYSYSPQNVKKTYITALLDINKFGKITFSHYGDDSELFPALRIYVKRQK